MKRQKKPFDHVLLVCAGDGCRKHKSKKVRKALEDAAGGCGKKARVLVRECACMKACKQGPIVAAYPEGAWYSEVKASDAEDLVAEVIKGKGRGKAGRP